MKIYTTIHKEADITMAVMLNFVIDPLSLLNLDSLKRNSISHGFFTVLKKKRQHFFFSMLYLLRG